MQVKGELDEVRGPIKRQASISHLVNRMSSLFLAAYHKEDIDKGVEVKGGELAAKISVVPEEDLCRDDDGYVE